MNTNPEDVDLGLALGYPNYSIRKRLNNNSSGAGVNANSRVDLAFAASDPLSELVWSPHNGLSLKRANPAVADNKPFLLWNVGPSSSVLLPSQYIRSKGTGDDNAVDQGNLTVSQTVLLDSSDMFGDKATSVRPSRSHPHGTEGGDSIMEEEVGSGDAIQEEEDCRDEGDEDLCRPENVHIAAIAEISKKNSGLDTLADGISDCKVDMTINGSFSAELIKKSHCSLNSSIEIYASRSGVVGLHVANPSERIVTKLSEALVCSLPNFQFQKEPDDDLTSATGEVNKNKTDVPFSIPAPPLKNMVPSAENDLCNPTAKETCSSGGMKPPRENSHPVEGSPTGSRICLDQEKGKEKALSDGDIYGRSSNDEDDSHESVESCNSAESFSKGVKRQSYDQELVLESKRMKKNIHGSPGSTSIVRPDSSFMNWISNMVKGLSDSNREDSSPLALTPACTYDVYGNYSQENFPSKKTHDSASLDMGFQTRFQSLSCRNPTISNNEVQRENDSKEESRELMVADKTSLGNLPGSCNKDVNPVIIGQPSKPWIFSAYIDCPPRACESDLAENKASEKKGVIPSDSPGEEMNSTAEGTTPDIPLAMSHVPEKSNPLTSLWINRFSTRTPRLEKCDEITRETNECSPKVNLDRVVDDVLPIYASQKEIQRFTANAEVSVDMKSTSKLCPILPSHEIRSSEAMASVFARRVDALRHIKPSRGRNASTSLVTCFFCGNGHDLRECPDVTKAELEDLLLKKSSFDGVEESSCLCIRCFRSDHWAISCPLAPSSSHLRSKQNASSFPSYQSWNVKEYLSKRVSTSNEIRRRTESSLGNNEKTNWNLPQSNFVTAQNRVLSSEVFNAIKNLRLSRADILRWMNSDVSLSHLNGFFLRLRLGKLEAGLGGTSYYVACITGDAREHNGCRSNKSILVDVGGIRSSVGSQFVSNQDFLEDEIKAWWCRTVDSGRKIPSLDELNSKLNDRKILGFQ